MPRHLRVRSRVTVVGALVAVVAGLVLVAFAPARAASPAGGRVSATEPSIQWTGGPFLAINPTVDTDCVVAQAPFCDSFDLEIGALDPTAPDVVVSVVAGSGSDLLNLVVYDDAGAKVAESTGLGSSQVLVLDHAVAGRYSVRTELLLGTPGSSTYAGTATVGDAGTPVDLSQECTLEQTALALTPDAGQWVDLDVLVLLDGVDPAFAADFFRTVSKPYEELHVRVVPTFQTAVPGFVGDSTVDLIAQARSRFPGGKVPADYDVVEVLTAKDIQALGQYAVAGQADCLGGLAYDERSFEVSEVGVPGVSEDGIKFGPVTLDAHFAAKVTAHELGHLLGGQHHYANCVEGIDTADPAAEQADTAPCTLMFNAADFVSLHFGTLNGRIVRGYALTYAAANDVDEPPVCDTKIKKKGCRPARSSAVRSVPGSGT
jgi:hypothetical protein